MKYNEIVNEGPLDWAGRVAGGVQSALQKGGSFSTGYQQAAGQQELMNHVKLTLPAWNRAVISFRNQGMDDAAIAAQMKGWTERYLPVENLPPYPDKTVTAQGAQKYLLAAVSKKMAGAPAATTPAGNVNLKGNAATVSGTTGNAGPTVSTTTANTAPSSTTTVANAAPTVTTTANAAPTVGNTGTASNANATVSSTTVTPTTDYFKNPASFKEEWDKYSAAKGNYALISNPELLSVLKRIWMKTGGLKAESKNCKGNPL